jgi:hypothetical protein
MTNDNDNDSREAAEAWARDNDLVLQQAAEIEQLRAERAALVRVVEQAQQTSAEIHHWLTADEEYDLNVLADAAADLEADARAALAKAGDAR